MAIAIVVSFVIGVGVGILVAPSILFSMHHGQFPPGGNFGGSTVNAVGTPFSSFQYASSAYLISGNATLSASGKIATGDFNLAAAQLDNGSTEYSIKFDEIGTVYNVTIAHGDKLYFVDTNLADDTPGSDMSLGDDGYAVVNSTGCIVAFKYPLPST